MCECECVAKMVLLLELLYSVFAVQVLLLDLLDSILLLLLPTDRPVGCHLQYLSRVCSSFLINAHVPIYDAVICSF